MPRKDRPPHVRFASDSSRSDLYTVDLRRLVYAVDRCGLEEPVEVCIEQGTSDTGGYEFTGRVHRITVSAELSALEASRTLWHELAHAAQVERYGVDEFDRIYDEEVERIQLDEASPDERNSIYYENRLEREARKVEKQAHIYPLCFKKEQPSAY